MDSWTDQQLKLMKCGGNQKCAQYLSSKGVASGTAIKQKYESDAAQLYKEVLKARAEGRPEPTELVKKAPQSNNSYVSSSASSSMHGAGASGKPGEDPNGMERLTGETDEQYVVRQTRLRDEAKARMAAKFGGGGGMGGVGSGSMSGGKGRMGGIGSDSSYNPATGGYGAGGVDVNAVTNSLASGFGAAFGALGSAATAATTTASAFVSDPGTQQTLSTLKSSVTTSAGGFWGSLTAGASAVASAVTAPDDAGDDGLADLQRQFSQQRGAHPSKYAGFGSDSTGGGASSTSNNSYGNAPTTTTTNPGADPAPASSKMNRHLPGEDPNGIERLTGETDDQYVARQTRLRDEARARMAAKFGGGGMGGVGSSSGMDGMGSGGVGGMMGGFSSSASAGGMMGGFGSSAPAPMSAPALKPVVAAAPKPPSSGNSMQDMKKKMQNSDDFFSSFGS